MEARVRAPLTRESIIRAAVNLADEVGVDALSMRRLGAELGVEAMSLYGHIADKAAVLDGIAEFVLGEIYLNGLETDPVGMEWDDCLRAMARAFRRTAVAHPGSFPLVLTRPVGSSTALHVTRVVLGVFNDAGLSPTESVHAMRAFTALLTGSLMRELGATPAFSGLSPKDVDSQGHGAAAERIPRARRGGRGACGVSPRDRVRVRCRPADQRHPPALPGGRAHPGTLRLSRAVSPPRFAAYRRHRRCRCGVLDSWREVTGVSYVHGHARGLGWVAGHYRQPHRPDGQQLGLGQSVADPCDGASVRRVRPRTGEVSRPAGRGRTRD